MVRFHEFITDLALDTTSVTQQLIHPPHATHSFSSHGRGIDSPQRGVRQREETAVSHMVWRMAKSMRARVLLDVFTIRLSNYGHICSLATSQAMIPGQDWYHFRSYLNDSHHGFIS